MAPIDDPEFDPAGDPARAGWLRRVALDRLDAEESERARFAALLHDEVGQMLTALKLSLPTPDPRAAVDASGIAEARSLLDDLIERVRELQLDLRPAMLDDIGLKETLEWFLERSGRDRRLAVTPDLRLPDGLRGGEPLITGFRVVEAAVAALGSPQAPVDVRLVVSGGAEGIEIDLRADAEPAPGGAAVLSRARDRVILLGGSMAIGRRAGGLTVAAQLPDQPQDRTGDEIA